MWNRPFFKKKKRYQMKKYYSCDCMCHELVKAKFSNLKCHEKILKSITDDNSKIRKVVSVWMTLALSKFILRKNIEFFVSIV